MANWAALTSPFARLAVITSAAAGIAYAIGEWLPYGYIAPVPAAVTAVVVTSTTAAKAWKMGLVQVVGIAFGAALALLAVRYLGYSAVTIALLVLSSFGIVTLMKRVKGISAPKAASSIAVSVIIVMGSHLTTNDAIDRFLGVLVGALIGLGLSMLMSTNSSLESTEVEIDDLYAAVGVLSGDISAGLSAGEFHDSSNWYQRTLQIRDTYRQQGEYLTELEESSRWSPLISGSSAVSLRRRYDALGMTITRLVAITSDLKAAENRDLLSDAPTSVLRPLSQLFGDVSQTLDSGHESIKRTEVNQSVRDTLDAATKADLPTEEIAVVGGIVQNAKRLISLEDTQPMEPTK